jgi:Protein-disulfide isomerase
MHRFQVIVMTALMAFSLAACNGAKTGATGALPDDMSQGNPNAKVTVIEYASVGCPVCGRWQTEVYPELKAKFIDTGKIHYVFREMLVGGGSEVAVASGGFLLARCAGKDKYFAVTDEIFHAQQQIFTSGDLRGGLLRIAQSLGMTEPQFNACIGDQNALKALNARVEQAAKDGIDSTPTFIINGEKLVGEQTLAQLDKAISDAEKK